MPIVATPGTLFEMSHRALHAIAAEVSLVEVCKCGKRSAIDDADPWPGELYEAVLAQPAQHAVDVRNTEAEDIGELRLGDGQVERAAVAHADAGEAGGHLEQKVREPLLSIAPADVRKMLAEYGVLASHGPEEGQRKLGMIVKDRRDVIETDGVYDRFAEGADGVERRIEQASRVTDRVSWNRDVEHVTTAVRHDPVAECETLGEHEKVVVFAALGDDVGATPDWTCSGREALEYLAFLSGDKSPLRQMRSQLREEDEFFATRNNRHFRSPVGLLDLGLDANFDAEAA